MPDVDFDSLVRDLESAVRQPDFAVIRARRDRRRLRTGVNRAVAIVIAAMLAALGGWALNTAPGADRHTPSGPTSVDRFGVMVSGRMIFMLRGVCSATCAPGSVDSLSFQKTETADPAWRVAATGLPPGRVVPIDSIGPLISYNGLNAYYAVGGTIYSSGDTGKTWHAQTVDRDPAARPGPASAYGESGLMIVGEHLYYVHTGEPAKPLALPPGVGHVSALSYYSNADDGVYDKYFVGMLATVNGRPHVYEHLGRDWIEDPADPCPGGSVASLATINSIDGNTQIGTPQYVVCSGRGGAATFRTSDDNGATWSPPVRLDGPASTWTAIIDGGSEHKGNDAAVFGSTDGHFVYTADASNVDDLTPAEARGHALAGFASANGASVFQDVTSDVIYIVVVDRQGTVTTSTAPATTYRDTSHGHRTRGRGAGMLSPGLAAIH
jgi:hypothetical protein